MNTIEVAAGETGMLRIEPVGDLALEAGGVLQDVSIAYRSWGHLNAQADNAVLILHALTGSPQVAATGGHPPEWWEGLVGPGAAIDTDRYFVVATNMLGGCHGSTGPASTAPDRRRYGSRFPLVTIRDSVLAEARLANRLGISRWHAVLGGSLGAARALEWAATFPDRVARCGIFAGNAASTAEQIAFAQTQLLAIRADPHFAGGDYYDGVLPTAGLQLARRIAHITYRSEGELAARFGRTPQPGEEPVSQARLRSAGTSRQRYQVESYLDHQGGKLSARFDANSYIALTEALISHDVSRGRGSLARALAGTADVEFLIAAVSSDRLYLPEQSNRLAAALPGTAEVRTIDSASGHDGFLTEVAAVRQLLAASFFP